MALFVGVDIGGTFTDLVIPMKKLTAFPPLLKSRLARQPEKAVVEALEQILEDTEKVRLFSHATTLATNSLLTHRGLAKTALVTNHGFRDILEIGRQRRPEIYNLHTNRPIPIVERKDRLVVRERTLSNGSLSEPVSTKDLQTAFKEIIRARYESVAIAFLNSYTNSTSERQTGKFLSDSGFKGHIDLSGEINPEYREYERTSTTVVNASLAPAVSNYLIALKKGLERAGITIPIYVMNSDGTVSTASQASKRPISIIESGPAAGVLSSKYLAHLLSLDKVITFDMGGTTAKAGTIINGSPDLANEFEAAGRTYHGRSIKGSGYPVRLPFIDLAEVSAGGGTIAWLDDANDLQVGPESAGAEPGPAAYGKGGKQATVTDANIAAGRINPEKLLGGQLRLRYDLATKAIGKLSRGLRTSIDKTAENVLRMVNNNMSKALSLVSIERGRDPRECILVAFGGAGPLHACDLAEDLGIKKIIIPIHPGLFSAFGLLTATELSRTFSHPILSPITRNVDDHFKQLREQARETMKQEGFPTYNTVEQIDLRYEGQAYDITIPYRRGSNLTHRFGNEHKKLYGYSSDHRVEAVNARLRVVVKTPKAKLRKKRRGDSKPRTYNQSRRVYISNGWQNAPIFTRELLESGNIGKGPCVIEEYDSTSVIGKQWSWKIDCYENIELVKA